MYTKITCRKRNFRKIEKYGILFETKIIAISA